MDIIATCPYCGCSWRLDFAAADRRITCDKCGGLFKVPDLAQLHKALETLQNADGPIYVDRDGNIYG